MNLHYSFILKKIQKLCAQIIHPFKRNDISISRNVKDIVEYFLLLQKIINDKLTMKNILTTCILSSLFAVFAMAQPKNIILVIADGVGYNHAQIITSRNDCVLNSFDIQYAVSNYPTYWSTLDKEYDVNYYRGDYHVRRIWQEFDYADSLPIDPITAGSALATGVKPAVDAVSYDMDNSNLETIIERAITKGKATAIATNADILGNNAVIPFVSHAKVANSETQYNALFQSMVNASTVSMVITKSDITTLSNPNWSLVQTTSNIPDNLSTQILFANNSLTNDVYCTASNSCLSLLKTNSNGFVFVSEFASVAVAAEQQNVEATKLAMIDLNTYINSIYTWVETNSSWDETLMIVVGAYEQGYATSTSFDKENPGDKFFSQNANDILYNSEYATNLLTPLFAKGNGSSLFSNYIDETDFYLGSYINNTEIAQVCFRTMPLETTTPKNIILMINDGCGISPIKAADYYTGTRQQYEDFPVQLWNCTHPTTTSAATNIVNSWNNSYESRLAWTDKKYFWKLNNGTCSGASATAIASGKKTYYYSLGVDVERNAMNSIARYAKSIGKSAGVATNAAFYDATPGAFFTNNIARENYSELSRQVIIESDADVIIGTGHPEYDKKAQKLETPNYDNIGGETMIQDLRNTATTYQIPSNSGWSTVRDIDKDGIPDPWTFVEDSANLVKYMTGETPKRLFGLMPVASGLQFYRIGQNDLDSVRFDDWNPGLPHLWQIGRTAINCLSKNENGFFVMIEGDFVDNGGHKGWSGRQIEEQISFNETVDSVIAWIEKNSSWDETLLIVTADHETGFVADETFREDSILLNHWQIKDNGVGNMPGMAYYSDSHTNQLVPLFAKGVGAQALTRYADEWDFVRGKYLNNSEISQTLFELWGGESCTFVNESPKSTFTDTIFVKQDSAFRFVLPKNFISDVEDNEITIKVATKPLWVKYNADSCIIYGQAPHAVGTSPIAFNASDGTTTGASITAKIYVQICVYQEDATAIDNQPKEDNYSVYPIPTIVSITVESSNSEGMIVLRDLQGRIVKTKSITSNKTEIYTKDLPKGEYIIQISEGENITCKKIIVR